jgi:hypothetical protein
MKNSDIADPIFREAVEAIDGGNIDVLKRLIDSHPRLLTERTSLPQDGYFKDPYLLFFVAGNPIRNHKLPSNIIAITAILIRELKNKAPESVQEQLDYTLGLIATGNTPRKCGVQLEMIDLLIDEGAKPDNGLGALASGNIAAAKHLIEKGGQLTLAGAVGLDQMDEVKRLAIEASPDEKLLALTVASFYGKTDLIAYLLELGADPNGYPKSGTGFHSHATPLHQAVSSGSLSAVKLLVETGARLDLRDKAYTGTPLDWALYLQNDEGADESAKNNFVVVGEYLQGKEAVR